MAGVSRRPSGDPRRPRRSCRSEPSCRRAGAVPHPAAEDRKLLGRVERDRNRHGRRRRVDPPTSARRVRLLGLCGRRPLPADRHECGPRRPRRPPRLQGRDFHLTAQIRWRPRHARRPRREARALPERRARRPGRRHGLLRVADAALVPRGSGSSRGGRHTSDRRVDPSGPRVPAQGGGRHPIASKSSNAPLSAARSTPGTPTRE